MTRGVLAILLMAVIVVGSAFFGAEYLAALIFPVVIWFDVFAQRKKVGRNG